MATDQLCACVCRLAGRRRRGQRHQVRHGVLPRAGRRRFQRYACCFVFFSRLGDTVSPAFIRGMNELTLTDPCILFHSNQSASPSPGSGQTSPASSPSATSTPSPRDWYVLAPACSVSTLLTDLAPTNASRVLSSDGHRLRAGERPGQELAEAAGARRQAHRLQGGKRYYY